MRTRKKNPAVNDIKSYKLANTPSKFNTIVFSEDEKFLKKIYSIEPNKEWRKMCVKKIIDQKFLRKVVIKDTSERVRYQASKQLNNTNWDILHKVINNDPSPKIVKYLKNRYKRLPNCFKFIFD